MVAQTEQSASTTTIFVRVFNTTLVFLIFGSVTNRSGLKFFQPVCWHQVSPGFTSRAWRSHGLSSIPWLASGASPGASQSWRMRDANACVGTQLLTFLSQDSPETQNNRLLCFLQSSSTCMGPVLSVATRIKRFSKMFDNTPKLDFKCGFGQLEWEFVWFCFGLGFYAGD